MRNRSFSSGMRESFLNVSGKFLGALASDIGVDLGTANTIVYVSGMGVVVNEPTIVAINNKTGEIIAIGKEAQCMLGRTPGIIDTLRPMKDGAVANPNVTEEMLRTFIRRAHSRHSVVPPRIVIAVPSSITELERQAVKSAAERAGARKVYCIEQAMAAAIGSGLPVHDPSGNMIIDIGGGTTEVAITSLSGTVYSKSLRVAGNEMNDAIVQYMKREYNLLIGEQTAEELKIAIGSAYPLGENEMKKEVRGRDLNVGLPKTITISSTEIRQALKDPVDAIVNSVRDALEQCPPELSADLLDHGLMLAGGGALLRGLYKRIENETGLSVSIADEPLLAVAKGTGFIVEREDVLEKLALVNL